MTATKSKVWSFVPVACMSGLCSSRIEVEKKVSRAPPGQFGGLVSELVQGVFFLCGTRLSKRYTWEYFR